MDVINFPSAPTPNPGYNMPMSYNSDGRQIASEQRKTSGPSFANLISSNPQKVQTIQPQIITETNTSVKKRKKKEPSSEEASSSKNVVEETVYADSYEETNVLTKQIIQQADVMINEAKGEYDIIKAARTMKGRNLYMKNMMDAMASFMNMKMQGIKEINSNIKTANDAEYRRWKDTRALDQSDDNKAIADAYSAFISAPVGMPDYKLPTTNALTDTANIVRADYPDSIAQGMDANVVRYVNSLTPEENLMLHEKDAEQVMTYDQMTGIKAIKWVNKFTGEDIPNLPQEPDSVIADYTVDPRTMSATNNNINNTIRVIPVTNDGPDFSKL